MKPKRKRKLSKVEKILLESARKHLKEDIMPKREGMTDREILKSYIRSVHRSESDFHRGAIYEETHHEDLDRFVESALAQLRAHYREKIKGVGIERVVKEYVRNTPIAGDFDTTRALFFNDKAIEKLANAILKEIDKEMMR